MCLETGFFVTPTLEPRFHIAVDNGCIHLFHHPMGTDILYNILKFEQNMSRHTRDIKEFQKLVYIFVAMVTDDF